MTTDNKLTTTTKPPIGGLKKGIAANRAQAEYNLRSIDPTKVPNRLGLVLDDSGSMGTEGMENAHKAVKSFTLSCNSNDTSIAVYPLNAPSKPLSCDYDLINMYVGGIGSTGGTPVYSSLQDLIEKENITRAILFSDGSPTDSQLKGGGVDSYYSPYDKEKAKKVIALYKGKELAIDTIYIGQKDTPGYKEMEEIAKQTNGIFVHFQDTLSLSNSLKYLSPGFRGLLANPEIKARIERGEKI
jgi:hypothetical protein